MGRGSTLPFPSWRIINGAMRSALDTCITTQIEFHENDFERIGEEFRSGYWIGNEGHEILYKLAINSNNRSCWKAIEHYLHRKPFIWNGNRIHVGYQFDFGQCAVTCTSLHADHIVACSYNPMPIPGYCAFCEPNGRTQYVLDRRFKITRTDLKAESKRLKVLNKTKEKEKEWVPHSRPRLAGCQHRHPPSKSKCWR